MDGGDQSWWSKVARSSGGVQGQHKAITLRFRPIAPKPADAVPGSLLYPATSSLTGSKRGRKRKYVRVPKGTNNNRIRRTRNIRKAVPDLSKRQEAKVNDSSDEVVTLKLLPETSDLNQILVKKQQPENGCNKNDNNIISSIGPVFETGLVDLENVNPGGFRVPVRVVESWVTVEYMMNTHHHPCMDFGQPSRVLSFRNRNMERSDYLAQGDEQVRDLEADTCPGFVTDASNAVRWVNEAYKRLVVGDDDHLRRSTDVQVGVWLVIKEELVPRIGSSLRFSCLVKLKYKTASENGQPLRVMVVPCDAWRIMDLYGGVAWRLDLVAALKLGFS